ncbi:MAG: stress response translation initiation inhibitor YciH [Candidatus Caldarchaeales archaeon]
MVDSCPTCGLPKSLCVCQTITYEMQKIKVRLETKKWNKLVTLIEGFEGSDVDLDEVVSELKTRCACGGAVKNGVIILQGDQREKVPRILTEVYGIPSDRIEVI